MAYREVTMLETKEIVRQWLAGVPTKRIAARLGCDPKTVRRYLAAARSLGLAVGDSGPESVTEEVAADVIAAARRSPGKEIQVDTGWVLKLEPDKLQPGETAAIAARRYVASGRGLPEDRRPSAVSMARRRPRRRRDRHPGPSSS